MKFNTSKCEVIPTAGLNANLNKTLFPNDVIFKEEGNFEFIGGPIGSDDYCNQHTKERVDKAMEVLTALGELPDPQVALTLLRHCAAFGKLVYSLRVVPHLKHRSALEDFDAAVRDCFESFLGCSISDAEWTLASLSTRMGGLGLRNTESHSSAAFLSSQMACHDLCKKIDSHYTVNINDINSDIHEAIIDVNTRVNPNDSINIEIDKRPRQQKISQAIDTGTLERIKFDNATDVKLQAHLNLTTSSGAGSWLHAVPSRSLGTHIDPLLFRTMVQRRLRVPIYDADFHCPFCDEIVDKYGDHCLTCSCGGDRTKRHNLIRNEVFHFCASSGLNPELERPGILQSRPLAGARQENGAPRGQDENRRPADVYLPKWRRGTPAALDFAITSGLRRDMVNHSAEDGSKATKLYENFKRSHLDTEELCRDNGVTFIPVICEADGGGWGPAAHKVWSELAKHKSIRSGEPSSIIVSRLLQSLGLILHRENARSILRRYPGNTWQDCSELLAASADCLSNGDLNHSV